MRLSRMVLCLVAAMPAVGCFDVDGGGAAPLLIDNFDNGTLLPLDRHFDQWRCGRFPTVDKQGCECGYADSTFRSYPYSLFLKATIEDPSIGAQLYTQADVPEDLSHMREIVFSAKFDSSIPSSAVLFVELYCSLCSDPSQITPRVQHKMDSWQLPGWQTFAIALSDDNFLVPTNYGKIEGGLAACLERVDGIHFSVNAHLPDGGSGSVTFNVDDIYFR